MLANVEVGKKSLEDYRQFVGDDVIDEIRELCRPLKGAKVVHVNATAFGGGVAEILQTLVPLMQDVGLKASWQVIEGADEFFNVTKAMHNGLQGMDIPFTAQMQETWRRYNENNAANFEGDYDFVVIHDPQPAGLLKYSGGSAGRHWMWRCHIDTSTPNPAYWDFLSPYINLYEGGIFTLASYVGPGVNFRVLAEIAPTIDPLAVKNRPMPLEAARNIVARYGFDTARPLMVQVSRFDPWKDPLGVIDAYRIVKQAVLGVQLALVGSMASDDPEGWDYYDRTVRHAGEDFDVKVLHNFHGVGNTEVNAFQTAADVVVQKSTREGFGLVVAEAMWKSKPVIGGAVGGIPLQIVEEETGFLVANSEACASRALSLVSSPQMAKDMGIAAREHVRRHFLSTRHLADYLRLFNRLEA